MRILIADDELANSKLLRSLFGAGNKGRNKQRATAGAPEIGRVVLARSQPKKRGKVAKGRAGAAGSQNVYIDLGDQPEQAAALFDALGIALLNRGDPEGAALIELGLRIRRKFYGNDHPATALSLNSYSRVLRERSDYAGAVDTANDALRINRRVFGERGYPVVASLLDLALAQLLQGMFKEAIDSAQTGLSILQDVGLYDTDPNTTRLLDVIGRAQRAFNRLSDATATYQTLLALDKKQLGTRKHPKYATHLANFGLVLEAQNKRKAAASTYRDAIDLYLNTLNRDRHPNLIDAYANLGSVLRPVDAKEAGRYLEKALELGKSVRGESHILTGNDYANFARWQYDTASRDDASKSFAKAFNIYSQNVVDRALPKDHYFIAEVLTWQGRIAVEQNSPQGGKDAEPLLRQALDIWPVQLGVGSVGESLAKGFLGRALGLQGNATESCRLLCESYRELKLNPPTNPEVVKEIAQWIKEQGCDCGPMPSAKQARSKG